MKKRNKIIIIVVSVIAFLVIGGIFGANLFIGTDKFKDILIGRMEKELDAKVSMDEWDASIFSGIKFTNLSVDQPEGFGNGKLFTTDLFTVQFDFWNLIRKKITFSEIIIEELSVNLNQNADGLWFFQTKSSQDVDVPVEKIEEKEGAMSSAPLMPADTNLVLLAQKLKIENASFVARDKVGNIIGELKKLNINGKINIDGSKNDVVLNMTAPIVNISPQISGLTDNVSVKNLELRVKADENEVQLENLSLEIFDGLVELSLIAKNYQSDKLDAEVGIRVDNLNPLPILNIVDQPENMISSPITCNISSKFQIGSVGPIKNFIEMPGEIDRLLKGDQNTLPVLCNLLDTITNIESKITLGRIEANNIADIEKLVIHKVVLPLHIEKRSISLDDIEVYLYGGKLLTSLNLDIKPDSLGLKIDFETKDLNSAPLMVLSGIEDDIVKGDINMKMSMESEIKNPLPFAIETIDTSAIKGTFSIGEIVTKPAGKIDSVNLDYSITGGKIAISPLLIKAYNGEIKASVEANQLQSGSPVFDINFDITNLDGKKLLKSIGEDPELIAGSLNMKMSAKGSGSSLDNIEVESMVEIGALTALGDMEIEQIKIPLKLKNGDVSIKPMIKAFNGEFNAVVNASNVMNIEPDTKKPLPVFDLKASISNMDSTPFLLIGELDPTMISGPVNLDLTAKGKGNALENLEADVTVEVPEINVEIAKAIVENINSKIEFANQIAVIKEFNAQVFDGSVNMQGNYYVDKNIYDADVYMDSLSLSTALEGVVKEIPQIQKLLDVTNVMTGSATGSMKVTGSIENIDQIDGTFDFGIKDGVISGHPIQERLSKILGVKELKHIEFSNIDTKGSIAEGMLVKLDIFDLKSENMTFYTTDGIVDINRDKLDLPVEIGLSEKIAEKLDKPVKEIQYGLVKKKDGMHYLPPFSITGSLSRPDIEKAMVQVLTKTAAKGLLRKEVIKATGIDLFEEKESDNDKEEGNDNVDDDVASELDETVDKVKDVLDGVFKGLFGGKK